MVIRSLFQAAKEQNADIMVRLDSDGQHDPDPIPWLIEPIEKWRSDLVIGSRFLSEVDKEKIPKYRTFRLQV